MSNNNDFFVKFDSNATAWAKQLETQLEPARATVREFQAELLAMQGRAAAAGKVAQAALALGNQVPAPGKTPPATPPSKTPPPTPAAKNPPPPPPAQPQPQLQTTLGKIDISSLQQAVYEHEDALKETRTHLATTITALRKLPDEMKSVLRSIKASAENERRLDQGKGLPSVVPGQSGFVKAGTSGSVVVGSDEHRVNQIVRRLGDSLLSGRAATPLIPTGAGPSVPAPSISDISRAAIDKANFDRVILAIRAQTRVMQSGLPLRGSLPTPPTTNNIPAGSAPSAPTTRSVTTTDTADSTKAPVTTTAGSTTRGDEPSLEGMNSRLDVLKSAVASYDASIERMTAALGDTLSDAERSALDDLRNTRTAAAAELAKVERATTGVSRAEQSAQNKAEFAASRTTMTDVERDERDRLSTLLSSVSASDFTSRSEGRADARNGNYSVRDLQDMALAFQGQGVDVPFNSRTSKKELTASLLQGREQYAQLYPNGNPALDTRGAQIVKTTKIADETAAILGDLDQVIRERRQALDIRGADIRSGGAKDEPFRGAREFGATTLDDNVPTPLSRGVGGSPAEVRRAQAILGDRSAEPVITDLVKSFATNPAFDPYSVPRPVVGDRKNQDEMDRGMAAVTRLRDVRNATLEMDKLGATFFALRSRIQESTEFIDRANSRLNRAAEMGVPTGNAMRQALDDGTLDRNAVALAGLKGMEEKLVTDQSNVDKTRTAMPEFRAELRDLLTSNPFLASDEYRQGYDRRNPGAPLPEGAQGPLGPAATYLASVQRTMEGSGARALSDVRLLRESVASTIAGSRQVIGSKQDLQKSTPGLQYTNDRFTMADGLSRKDEAKLNELADAYGRSLARLTRLRGEEYTSAADLIAAEEKLENRANALANQIASLANGLAPSLRTLVGEEKYNEDGSRVADQRVPDEDILEDERRRQYARDLAEQERNRSFRTPESEVRTGELAIASAQERLAEAIAQRAVAQERYAAQERALVAGADGNPDPKKVNALSRSGIIQQDIEQAQLDTDRLKDIRNQVEDPNNFRSEPIYDGLHNHGPKSTIEGSIADFDESIRRLSAKRELLDAERNVRDPKKPNQDLLDPQAADKLDRDIARATSMRDQLADIQTRVGSGRMTDLIEGLEGRTNPVSKDGTLDVARQEAGQILGGAGKVRDLGKAYNNLEAMDREIQKMEASLADTEDKLKKSRAAVEKSGDTETKKAAAETKSNVVTQESIKANNDRIAVLRKEGAALRADGPYKKGERDALYNGGAGAEDPEYLAVKKRYDRLSAIGKEISALSRANLTDAEAERQALLRKQRTEIRAEGPYTKGEKDALYNKGAGAEDPEYLATLDRYNRIAAINKELATLGKGGDSGGTIPPGGTSSGASSESGGDSSRSLLAQILGQLKSIHATMKSGGMKVTNSVAAKATQLAETNAAGKVSARSQTATDAELRAAGVGPYSGQPVIPEDRAAAIEQQRRRETRLRTSDIEKAQKAASEMVQAELKEERAELGRAEKAIREKVRAEEQAALATSRLTDQSRRELAVLKQLTDAANQAATAEERLARSKAVANQQSRVAGVIGRELSDQRVLAPDRREAIGTVLNANGPRVDSGELDSILRSARNNPEFQRLGSATGMGFGEDMGDGMIDGFARVFGGGSSFMSRVVNTTGTFLVRNFAAGAVFGLTAQLQMVLEQAIQAEATFVRVSAALEATGKDTGSIRADLQGIASEYGTNLNDVYSQAAGLTGLFDNAEDLAAGTKIASQLQIISGGAVNATEAVGILSSTLSAFAGELPPGLEGAQKVADVLTSIQNNLNVNIETSAEGVSRMAGLADQMSLSFEETAVFTAQIAKQTNQTGAGAGEQFSRILSNLQTGRGRGAVVEAFGPVIEAPLIDNDYGAVIEVMIQKWDTLTATQQRNVVSSVAGARQAASFNALINNSEKTLAALTKARHSDGDATDRMDKLVQTLNNRLARFGTNVQGLVSNLVQSGLLNFLGVVLVVSNSVLEAVNAVLNTFNEFADSNPMLSFLRKIIGAALGAALAFKVLGSGVSSVRGIMAQTREGIEKRQELIEKRQAERAPAPVARPDGTFERVPYEPGPIRRNPLAVTEIGGSLADGGRLAMAPQANPGGAWLTRGVGRTLDATLGRAIGSGTAGLAKGFNGLSTKLKPLNADVSTFKTGLAAASRNLGTFTAFTGQAVQSGISQVGRGGQFTSLAVRGANSLADVAEARQAQAEANRYAYADQERYAQITGSGSDERRREFRENLLYQGLTPDEIQQRTAAPDPRLLAQADSLERMGRVAGTASTRMGKLATSLSSMAKSGIGADVAMAGFAIVLGSVVAAMGRHSEAAKQLRENYDKSFGEEGGSKKETRSDRAAFVGFNYEDSQKRYDDFRDEGTISRAFTVLGGAFTNGVEGFVKSATGDLRYVTEREYGLDEDGKRDGREEANAFLADAKGRLNGLAKDTPSAGIRLVQEAATEELGRMAKNIKRDEDLSDAQKVAQLGELERVRQQFSELAADNMAIADGLRSTMAFTSDQVKQINTAFSAIKSTGGVSRIAGVNLEGIYAELITDAGIPEDSASGKVLDRVAAGNADSVDFAVAEATLLRENVIALNAEWKAKIAERADPDVIEAVKSELTAEVAKLGTATDNIISSILEQADLVAGQQAATGRYSAALRTYSAAIDRANREYDRLMDQQKQQKRELDRYVESLPSDLQGLPAPKVPGLFGYKDGQSRAAKQDARNNRAQIAELISRQTELALTEATQSIENEIAATTDSTVQAELEAKRAAIEARILGRVNAGKPVKGVPSAAENPREADIAIDEDRINEANNAAIRANIANAEAIEAREAAAREAKSDITNAKLGVQLAYANAQDDSAAALRIETEIARTSLAAAKVELAAAEGAEETAAARLAVLDATAQVISAEAAAAEELEVKAAENRQHAVDLRVANLGIRGAYADAFENSVASTRIQAKIAEARLAGAKLDLAAAQSDEDKKSALLAVLAAQAEVIGADEAVRDAVEARAEERRQAVNDERAAQLGVRQAYAESEQDSVRSAQIQVQIARVSVRAARAQLRAADTAAETSAAIVAILSAQAGLIGAQAASQDAVETKAAEVRQGAADLEQAQLGVQLAYAEAEENSVKAARIQEVMARAALSAAQAEYDAAKGAAERTAALVAVVNARAGVIGAEANTAAAVDTRAADARQAAADLEQAQLGVRAAYAEAADNSVQAARIQELMAQAALAAAKAEEATADTAAERTAAQIAVLSAQAGVIGAAANTADAVATEAAEARQNAANLRQAQLGIGAAYADARGDAVLSARIQVAMGRAQLAAARAELGAARTASEQAAARVMILQAQAQIIGGVAASQAAQADFVQSQYEVSIALAEAAGNTVLAAERSLGAARTALRQAMSRSKGKATAEVNAAKAEAIRAEAAARDARLQDDLDTIDFNLEMGKITQSSAIAALKEIVRTRDLTKEQRRQLLLQIKGMKDEMADSQWNFGDIRMPTPYQMRRYITERRDQFRRELDMASGTSTNLGGAGGGMVTNNGGNTNTTNVEITINGADTEKVKRLIQDVVGGGRSLNRTTGARRGR